MPSEKWIAQQTIDNFWLEANTVEVGQFPAPLPEHLILFYGLYTIFQDIEEKLAADVDAGFNNTTIYTIEEALKSELNTLDKIHNLGPKLIVQLKEIRDTPIP